jgi:glycosyltransferase involved in cell wall biosynthesis
VTPATPTARLSVVILTFNEARNLPACLESLRGWTPAVFVVDSGSTDATAQIAREAGATVVEHPFETHAKQWAWAIEHLPLRTGWVMGLDADQRVLPPLRAAIDQLLERPSDAAGAFVNRRQIFRGRWIRHGGYYPKYLLKVFRRDRVRVDPEDLVDHHFEVEGPTVVLDGDLVEDNLNEAAIAVWTAKHNRYAVLQARQEWREAAAGTPVPFGAVLGSPAERVQWLKQVWRRMPRLLRPCLYVSYRYIFRLGFLDGREGFIFHVLQGFWYRLLVDINLDEIAAGRIDD